MPRINGTLAALDPYIPNIMLDVPNGVFVQNAPVAPGTELYSANVQTRYTVDWDVVVQKVTHTRVQVVAKNSGGTGTVRAKIRDITSGADVAHAEFSSTATSLATGAWTPFNQPRSADLTYAVYIEGDGVVDPTIYSVLWEWRGPNTNTEK